LADTLSQRRLLGSAGTVAIRRAACRNGSAGSADRHPERSTHKIYLWFSQYGDEDKVNGLAPFGPDSFFAAIREIVHLLPDGGFELDLKFFRHHREDIAYSLGARFTGIRRFVFVRARGVAGAAASAGRSARGTPSRYRPLGPGDV